MVTGAVGATVAFTTVVVGGAVALTTGVVGGAVALTTAFVAGAVVLTTVSTTVFVVDTFEGAEVAFPVMCCIDMFKGADVACTTIYAVDIGGTGVEVVVGAGVETTPGRQQIIRRHDVRIIEDVLVSKKIGLL